MKALVLVAAALALSALDPSPAAACDCPRRSLAEHFAAADLVFLGDAGPAETRGRWRTQPVTVWEALKGRPGKRFVIKRRADVVEGCDVWFGEGEVVLVFATGGNVTACAGNVGMAWQLPRLDELLGALPGPAVKPTLETFRRAFEETLSSWVGDHPALSVAYAPLAGQTVALGPGRLTFVADASPAALEIQSALVVGRLHYVRGRLAKHDLDVAVLLLRSGDHLLLVGRRVRQGPLPLPAYRCERDSDCATSCATGAVNARWLQAHRAQVLGCKDGCARKGTEAPRCEARTCVGWDRGRRSSGCTERPIPWERSGR